MDKHLLYTCKILIDLNYQLLLQYHTINVSDCKKNNTSYHERRCEWLNNHFNLDYLYHFTSLENAHKILLTDNFLLFNSQDMNDLMEAKIAPKIISKMLGPFAKSNEIFLTEEEFDAYSVLDNSINGDFDSSYNIDICNKISNYIQYSGVGNEHFPAFLTSLSSPDVIQTGDYMQHRYDNLSMWISYGKNGKGAAVECNIHDLKYRVHTSDFFILPVIYEAEMQELFFKFLFRLLHDLIAQKKEVVDYVNSRLWHSYKTTEEISNPTEDQKIFVALLLRRICNLVFKHPCFAYENEWRIFYLCQTLFDYSDEFEWMEKNGSKVSFVSLKDKIDKPDSCRFLLPVSSIVFGPTLESHAKNSLLRQKDLQRCIKERNVDLKQSTLPYRS